MCKDHVSKERGDPKSPEDPTGVVQLQHLRPSTGSPTAYLYTPNPQRPPQTVTLKQP